MNFYQKRLNSATACNRGFSSFELLVIIFFIACISTFGFAGFYLAAHKAGGIATYWSNLPFVMKYCIYVPTFILLAGSLFTGLLLIAFLNSRQGSAGTDNPAQDAESGGKSPSQRDAADGNTGHMDISPDDRQE